MAHGLTTAGGAIRKTKRYGIFDPQFASVRRDASELDHFAPFICFVGHEFSEGGRCHRPRLSSQSKQPRLDNRISKDRVDLIVELVDDRRWCVFGRTEPVP